MPKDVVPHKELSLNDFIADFQLADTALSNDDLEVWQKIMAPLMSAQPVLTAMLLAKDLTRPLPSGKARQALLAYLKGTEHYLDTVGSELRPARLAVEKMIEAETQIQAGNMAGWQSAMLMAARYSPDLTSFVIIKELGRNWPDAHHHFLGPIVAQLIPALSVKHGPRTGEWFASKVLPYLMRGDNDFIPYLSRDGKKLDYWPHMKLTLR